MIWFSIVSDRYESAQVNVCHAVEDGIAHVYFDDLELWYVFSDIYVYLRYYLSELWKWYLS